MNNCPASSSADLPPPPNESRREEYLAKILHSERRFNDLRLRLHKAKMSQFEKLQDDILNRRCGFFQRRKIQLDSEFDTRRKNLQIIKTLRLDALSRKLTAQRDFALNNCEHDKEYTKQQICKRIDEKLEQVENEMKQIEDNFYDEIVSSFNSNHQTNKLSKQRLGRLKWGINRYLTSNNENNKIQQNVGDEGMEDEIVAPTSLTTTSQEHSISSVNFNFMGGLGATSTPVNANRNPFGSIQPKPSGLFGSTPQPQFGSGSVFGSSVINNQNSGNFGSFGAIGSGGSSGSSSFGSSPFAAAPVKPSIFGAAPFGSNVSSPFASNPVAGSGGSGGSGGGSMFGGGIKSGGGSTTGIGTTGFSAFASKSSAFGQLASQAQQQQTEQKPSLFGGGTALNTSGGGGTLFGGFGGSPTASTVPKPGFGQQKSSAFTTFRK